MHHADKQSVFSLPSPIFPKGNLLKLVSMSEKREKFLGIFPELRDELLGHFRGEGMPKVAEAWYKQSLDYNVTDGKLIRGLSVIDSFEILAGKQLDGEEYKRIAVLGWCVELLQAFLLVADDMMDRSVIRRNKPCYYCLPGIGNFAIHDAFMLESAIFQLLRVHFRAEACYTNLLDIFHETIYLTEMGQLVDLIIGPTPQSESSAAETASQLSRISLDVHHTICVYKTAYYSFYISVALAMRVSGITDPAAYALAKEILLPLGEYYQIQDDFLDWGGTREELGKKVGMDIIDGKCSWLVVMALSLATPDQRAILDECYGRKDSEKEARVRALYEELGLHHRYEEYEQDSYDKIVSLTNRIPEEGLGEVGKVKLKREVFRIFLDKVHKRRK